MSFYLEDRYSNIALFFQRLYLKRSLYKEGKTLFINFIYYKLEINPANASISASDLVAT